MCALCSLGLLCNPVLSCLLLCIADLSLAFIRLALFLVLQFVVIAMGFAE